VKKVADSSDSEEEDDEKAKIKKKKVDFRLFYRTLTDVVSEKERRVRVLRYL